ncbi:hypothetical protein OUZ56_027823 [Daphnia magna]|uniref:Uncharacterized protein n=1 Tax=Daphnia magna TaxID=35525 RepID=A0ABR0B216_9CRUS|nr:hypothetical protein OUZ56_027823 [Daphnia magna]
MSAWTLSAPDFAAWDTTGFLFPPLSLKKKKKNCREQAPDSLPDGRRDRDTCFPPFLISRVCLASAVIKNRAGEMKTRFVLIENNQPIGFQCATDSNHISIYTKEKKLKEMACPI